jgi:monothiol glutaredoxin
MDPATRDRIKGTIESNQVVLFMKGTRHMPQCGFSAQVVQILDGLGPKYETVNVLADPAIREGIKEYSSWPTIPQLYVGGEFIGGCDIVKELYASGELEQKLGVSSEPIAPPKVTIGETAVKAFRESLQEEGEFVRLEVSPRFEHGLSIGPKQAGDLELSASGLTLLLDRSSASRADGVHIDMIKTPQGPAFKVTNPNEAPRVRPMSASELKARIDSGEKPRILDVRTPEEREIAQIEGAELLDQDAAKKLLELDRDTLLVFHCHHGPRSQRAAEHFVSQGFKNVYNLSGGIDAWSLDVDPDVPRY